MWKLYTGVGFIGAGVVVVYLFLNGFMIPR